MEHCINLEICWEEQMSRASQLIVLMHVENFFIVVIEAHVVAAAMKLLGMQVLNNTPSEQ